MIATRGSSELVTLGIRPEDLRVDAGGHSATEHEGSTLSGRVVLVERLGGTSHVHFDVEGGRNRMMTSASNDRLPEVGETITVRVPPERVHLFGADGRALQ